MNQFYFLDSNDFFYQRTTKNEKKNMLKNYFSYNWFYLASFLRKKNNYCSEKCQTGNSCNNVNFTCPLCELGWKGPYCTRKWY